MEGALVPPRLGRLLLPVAHGEPGAGQGGGAEEEGVAPAVARVNGRRSAGIIIGGRRDGRT